MLPAPSFPRMRYRPPASAPRVRGEGVVDMVPPRSRCPPPRIGFPGILIARNLDPSHEAPDETQNRDPPPRRPGHPRGALRGGSAALESVRVSGLLLHPLAEPLLR